MSEDDCFIRRKMVLDITGMTQTALYRAIHFDGFPPPIKLAARQVAFSKVDVLKWMGSKKRLAYNLHGRSTQLAKHSTTEEL